MSTTDVSAELVGGMASSSQRFGAELQGSAVREPLHFPLQPAGHVAGWPFHPCLEGGIQGQELVNRRWSVRYDCSGQFLHLAGSCDVSVSLQTCASKLVQDVPEGRPGFFTIARACTSFTAQVSDMPKNENCN